MKNVFALVASLALLPSVSLADEPTCYPDEQTLVNAYYTNEAKQTIRETFDKVPPAKEVIEVVKRYDFDRDGQKDLLVWNALLECGTMGCTPSTYLKTKKGYCFSNKYSFIVSADGKILK